MAREGKDLELLIEKLEKITLPQGAAIKSPDFIEDVITKDKREVDISIRYKFGTIDVLVIIECRDRTKTQDVTWIEQINTKVKDLRANKVIAVSSSSFSSGAVAKAEHFGIETRTLSEISYDVIKSWWQVQEIPVLTQSYNMINTTFIIEGDPLPMEFFNGKTTTDPIITRASDGLMFSSNQIFNSIANKIPDWNSLLPNMPPLRKVVDAQNATPGHDIHIEYNGKKYKIARMQFTVDLFIVAKNVPINKISSYENKDGPISRVIEYKNITDENSTLQIIRNPDGSISLAFSQDKINKQ